MLKEIRCDHFVEEVVTFHEGLNVVLGDSRSTNSIGKSTLLMIIDFVYGGETYITKDGGSRRMLGEHAIKFCFLFEDVNYYYTRETIEPKLVYICDSDYLKIEPITIDNFNSELKKQYQIVDSKLSFRSAVSLYSRIWGKENLDVDKPLHSHKHDTDKGAVENLLKLCNYFEKISDLQSKLDEGLDSKKVLKAAVKKNYLPSTTKTEFKQNAIKITNLEGQYNDIKSNLLKYTIDLTELKNKEILELKSTKVTLVNARSSLQNKLNRIERNLIGNSQINSKDFQLLTTFFKDINIDRISEIEHFHSKIATILKDDLKSAKNKLVEQIKQFDNNIREVDTKLASLLKGVETPTFIVDKIFELTVEINKLKTVNNFYSETEALDVAIKSDKSRLQEVINDILINLNFALNERLSKINADIYSTDSQAPRINLEWKKYKYDHFYNTGTGKEYVDLIMFDLTIFALTNLPFIIHDTPLFKNIEDFTVERLVTVYGANRKQSFIAIDGIERYNDACQGLIRKSKAVELSNSKLLFKKDWRKNPGEEIM